LLRCSAAGVPLALAAEEVAEFSPALAVTPLALAGLLGLEDAASPAGAQGDRTLRLRCQAGSALVRVEGPVHIRPVAAAELLAVPRLLATRGGPGAGGAGPVIGFLEEAGQVVVLLDVRALVRLALAAGEMTGQPGERSTC
jgi:hypothetical protein